MKLYREYLRGGKKREPCGSLYSKVVMEDTTKYAYRMNYFTSEATEAYLEEADSTATTLRLPTAKGSGSW